MSYTYIEVIINKYIEYIIFITVFKDFSLFILFHINNQAHNNIVDIYCNIIK